MHDRAILMLSAGFFGVFLAFNTTQALQSSLNASLGNACLAALYTAFTLVAIPGPKLVKLLSPKTAMIMGASAYVLMIVANIAILNLDGHLWAQYLVGMPFNILVGVGAPLLWTGQAVYLNRVAESKHAQPDAEGEEADTKGEYNGTFYAMFQANGVVGLVFSSLLKDLASGDGVTTILFVVLSVCAAIGVFILTTLPHIDAVEEKADEEKAKAEDTDDDVGMAETLTFLLKEPRMYLFVPIILFNGMSLGFIFADYTKYVISEGLGDKNIGFVMAVFYGVNTICCKIFGSKTVLDKVGRRGLYIMSFGLLTVFFVYLCFGHKHLIGLDSNNMSNFVPPGTKVLVPNGNGTYVEDKKNWVAPAGHAGPTEYSYIFIFAGAALFAMGDAVLESVVPGTLQVYFAGDDKAQSASAANQKMWQSLGFAIQFAIGALFPSIDTSETVLQHFQLKVIILLVILFFGFILAIFALFKYDVSAPVDSSGLHEQLNPEPSAGSLDHETK